MCCLRYEHEFYVQSRKRFPKEGKLVRTKRGEEKLIANDIFRERVTLRGEDGELRTITLIELHDEAAEAGVPLAVPTPITAEEPQRGATQEPEVDEALFDESADPVLAVVAEVEDDDANEVNEVNDTSDTVSDVAGADATGDSQERRPHRRRGRRGGRRNRQGGRGPRGDGSAGGGDGATGSTP
jgi:hypothetical protein